MLQQLPGISALVLLTAAACGTAAAQTYPAKPVRMICSVAAGTAPDLVEIGQSSLMGSDQYKVKYFIPLTEQLEENSQRRPHLDADLPRRTQGWIQFHADPL